MARPIVLLTDFGPGSAYVGEVKGVLATLAPGAPVPCAPGRPVVRLTGEGH